MRIGQTFRYARPYSAELSQVDGLPNFFFHTRTDGTPMALLEAGINPIASLNSGDGQRIPAILLRSSPHKIGSSDTPWQDTFDPDRGHIRYFGDNKVQEPPIDPSAAPGNRALLKQFELHTSTEKEKRLLASPIICFRSVRVGNRTKGNIQFEGFGLIERAERITQYDRQKRCPFTNYVFDLAVFSLTAEKEEFDWAWVSARRNQELDLETCLKYAPASWRKWVNNGPGVLNKSRRRVVTLLTKSTEQQKPKTGSREEKALNTILSFYADKKKQFEALAAAISGRILSAKGNAYRHGWITPPSSDGGADFIGRIDVGTDLARAKLIVLGQAKCEKPTTPTGGNHIARTVARLRRGWIGIYVTTSYFSEPVQREVLEDKYPIVLVNGLRVAREVLLAVSEEGFDSISEYLEMIDSTYDEKVMQRDPEEILYE